MADWDTDLVGIIVACSVCVVCACVLFVLLGIYCCRRLDRQERKASHREEQTPYIVPVEYVSPVHLNSFHEPDKLTGYRPKILTRPDGITEQEYQEIVIREQENGEANIVSTHQDAQDTNKEGVISNQGSMQYRNAYVDRKGVIMTAVEPYRIIEPVPVVPYTVRSERSSSRSNSHKEVFKSIERSSTSSKDKVEQKDSDNDPSHQHKDTNSLEEENNAYIIRYDQVDLPTDTRNASSTKNVHIEALFQPLESATTRHVQESTNDTVKTTEITTETQSLQQTSNSTHSATTYGDDVFIDEEVRLAWKTRTYEEKGNSLEFESDDDQFANIPNEENDGGKIGLVSMQVKDYSYQDAPTVDTSIAQRIDNSANDYAILDYVDTEPSNTKARKNFQSVMSEIEEKYGENRQKTSTKEDVDASAERVPPAFTSTPRAPPEAESWENDVRNRQRKEHDGSVPFPPDNDMQL